MKPENNTEAHQIFSYYQSLSVYQTLHLWQEYLKQAGNELWTLIPHVTKVSVIMNLSIAFIPLWKLVKYNFMKITFSNLRGEKKKKVAGEKTFGNSSQEKYHQNWPF